MAKYDVTVVVRVETTPKGNLDETQITRKAIKRANGIIKSFEKAKMKAKLQEAKITVL